MRIGRRSAAEDLLDQRERHVLAPDDFPNSLREHELDFPATDFLVELHGCEQFLSLCGSQANLRRQARTPEQISNAFRAAAAKTQHLARQFRGRNLPDGDRFPVQIFAVANGVLNRVPDGVTKIQNGAQPGLGFVLPYDVRLDLAASRHNFGEQLRIKLQ